MSNFLRKFWIFGAILFLVGIFFVFRFKMELSAEFVKAIGKSQFYFASLILPQSQNEILDSKAQSKENDSKIVLTEADIGREQISGSSDNLDYFKEEDLQDKLDDIAEQIDVIKRQIDDLYSFVIPAKVGIQSEYKDTEKDQNTLDSPLQGNDNGELGDNKEQNQLTENETQNQDNSQSSGTKIDYPKILISEVQIAGIDNDKQEFVELYNPNEQDINLSGWYLQRKTKTSENFSTYVPNNLFLGKIIKAKSYFIIAREGNFYLSLVDVWANNPLTEDNSLVLKNPNREVSDLLGFGQATDYEGNLAENPANGLSVCRKWENNSERDADNNFADFEICNLTPRSQNLKYITPVNPPSPVGLGGSLTSKEVSKILISEILLGDNEFIELFNPNDTDINLTDWYLQRKTKTAESYSSYVTKSNFDGKKILANSYFLIVRQGSLYENLADIVFDQPLTEDNSLILKNFNGEISDKLGFGFATDFEVLATVAPENGKSLARKWLENSEQDTDNNFNDFEIKTPTPKAKNVEIPKDTIAPEVIFGALSETQTSLSFPINFEITDPLGTVTPSGLASYIFRSKEEGGEWNENAEINIVEKPQKFSVTENFSGQDKKTYYFQAKAKDIENNWSEFLPQNPIFAKIELPIIETTSPQTLPIVINEVQIEGQTSKDEFVELYNPNNQEIDLAGFSLKKKTTSGAESNLVSSGSFNGKISALGYFLIVPQDNDDGTLNYTGSVIPDLRYSGKSYSVADNNTILLYNKDGNLQDKVGFGNAIDFENSPSQNPPALKSITRTLGADTENNSVDFIILETPTPKAQ